jgi:hypothetical protein
MAPEPYRIPTRRERNIHYLEVFGFGFLAGALATLIGLLAVGVLR